MDDETKVTNATGFGLLGFRQWSQFPLTVDQRQRLEEMERQIAACTTQEQRRELLDSQQKFLSTVVENYAAAYKAQCLNVMLHSPSANEPDEVLAAFLSTNPLITKVGLLRLLISAIRSSRATFSHQKKKRSQAGKVGGQSTHKSKSAAKLKSWVDEQKTTIGEGGVRAVARRLAARASPDFHKSLDDVQRVIEEHLRSKLNTK